jgi:hypothetical protein
MVKTKRQKIKRKRNFLKTQKSKLSSSKPDKPNSIIQNKNLREKSLTKEKSSIKENKIKNFLKNNDVCSDSDYCVVFGFNDFLIKEIFNDFDTFENVIFSKIRKLGEKSSNGFIIEIPYKQGGNQFRVVLKSSVKEKSDNLIYEGIVGKVVNRFANQFPLFIKTYGIGNYIDENLYDKLANYNSQTSITENDLSGLNIRKTGVSYEFNNIGESCDKPIYNCILLEDLIHTKSFYDVLMDSKSDPNFFEKFISYMFQLYCPLDILKDKFTHYDLHYLNCLIYYPSMKCDTYITMKYHYPKGDVIKFKTCGISKIIDYGRSYFYYNATYNSSKLFDDVCDERKCKPSCGYLKGYQWFSSSPSKPSDYYINPYIQNVSHDLRLLNESKETLNEANIENSALNELIFNKLHYSVGLKNTPENNHYGTPEVKKGGYPNRILNVSDAHKLLKRVITSPEFIKQNESQFAGKTEMGTLDIWVNDSQPMKYVSTFR